MTTLEWLEALSYVVTVIGLPFAIVVFLQERRKERQNDDEDLYLQLSDEYAKFLRLVLEHADLHLITRSHPTSPFNSEQIERRNVLFELLISIFERAYILVYEDRMGRHASRLWQTWADYIREWCRRPDLRELLPSLLQGEDPEFQQYIRQIADEEAARSTGEAAGATETGATTISTPLDTNAGTYSRLHHRNRRSRLRNRSHSNSAVG
jgi:hypothetical protein